MVHPNDQGSVGMGDVLPELMDIPVPVCKASCYQASEDIIELPAEGPILFEICDLEHAVGRDTESGEPANRSLPPGLIIGF